SMRRVLNAGPALSNLEATCLAIVLLGHPENFQPQPFCRGSESSATENCYLRMSPGWPDGGRVFEAPPRRAGLSQNLIQCPAFEATDQERREGVDQVPLGLLLGLPLRMNVQRAAGRYEPLALLANPGGQIELHRYLHFEVTFPYF